MPRCSDCGFLYNVKRGPCPECGWGLTRPATAEDESQQRKVEAERAEWGRQQPPTRSGRWYGRSIAMVVVVIGILLLVPAACTTLLGVAFMGTDADYPPFTFDAGLEGFVLGLVGVAAAVGLLALGVRVWRRSG